MSTDTDSERFLKLEYQFFDAFSTKINSCRLAAAAKLEYAISSRERAKKILDIYVISGGTSQMANIMRKTIQDLDVTIKLLKDTIKARRRIVRRVSVVRS